MAIARHSMSGNVAHYIQSHGAIQQWVDVLRAKHIKPLESVERIVSLFCFLQDSSSCTQQLLDAFESADGYVFLAELLLFEETLNDDCDSSDALRNLILLIGSLTTCGFIELKPSSPPSGNMSGFRLPRPMGRGVSGRFFFYQVQFLIKLLSAQHQSVPSLADRVAQVQLAIDHKHNS